MPEQSRQTLTTYRLIGSEYEVRHHSYANEKLLLSMLLTLDGEELEKQLNNLSVVGEIGKMADNPDKQEEYLDVLIISMGIRRAIEAGMDPYEAYAMNDIYLQRLSAAAGAAEYRQIRSEFIHDFFVTFHQRMKEKGRSVHTERAKQYIRQNLTKRVTLPEVADYVGISPNRLTSLFTESEHMTMKEFILRERVSAAAEWLRLSRESIGTIASTLGFSSQSHFGAVFLRVMGETPSEYRKTHYIP